MTQKIALSPKSMALIAKLKKTKPLSKNLLETFKLGVLKTVEPTALLDWLTQSNESQLNERAKVLLAALHASLLKDLARSLPSYKKKKKSDNKLSWSRKAKNGLFGFLTIVGTLVFACDGFDGITLIVSVLPLSAPILFTVGIIFALISVLAFYAFDLTEIAKNLEISKKEAHRLVDNYLKEVEEINAIRDRINNDYINLKTSEELEADLQIIKTIIVRYNALDKGRDALSNQSENKNLVITRYLIAGLIGIVYFSCGFFAGQAVSLAIAGLIVTSVVPFFWPILAASFAVGAAAFLVYWFVERPSIDKLVGKWFGLEKEKIDLLCDSERMEKHKSKLENLKINLELRKHTLAAELEKNADYRTKLKSATQRIKELTQLSVQPTQELNFGFFSKSSPLTVPTRKTLTLRQKTQTLIEQLIDQTMESDKISQIFKPNPLENIKQTKIIKWFNQINQPAQPTTEKQDEDLQLLSASLNSALLKDLAGSLQIPLPEKKQKEKTTSYSSIYYFLALAGTLYFGCQGFEGITSLLSIFSVPKAAILIIGSIFALISVIAFQAFDLTEIAKNLGIKKKNVHKLVDIYLKEVETIKAIRRNLTELYPKRKTVGDLEEDLQITELINARYTKLDEERMELTNLSRDKKLTVLKYVVASIIGIIYFSTAFFTGQTVALALAGFFVASIAPLSWPVILVSTIVGLAALAVYWYVERPSIEKLVSSVVGLDQDKIGLLCNPKIVEEEKTKLKQLKTNLISCKEYLKANVAENALWEKQLQTADEEIKVLMLKSEEKKEVASNSTLSFNSSLANAPDSLFSTKELQPNSIPDLSAERLNI
ncbi:MAG: hypothetical protein H0U73_09615 [Tatlockia sp.]|nr:hypothetical protein [Tatlockia sp.]